MDTATAGPPAGWIDTHCHLDADSFDADRDAVVAQAAAVGVTMAVLPAAHAEHFDGARAVAQRYGFAYALGVHPLWVDRSHDDDTERLRVALREHRDDARLVAVGEIGLDYFVPGLDRERQQGFYRAQLKLARDAGLPVIVHVRRSADALLAHLRQIEVPGGIIHAFSGSLQQAQQFIALGFRLGFGGAMTYSGSRRIRQLAADLPASAWVLETDAPDIPPQWVRDAAHAAGTSPRNTPAELPRIAQQMAELRRLPLAEVMQQNRVNAIAALPRLACVPPAAREDGATRARSSPSPGAVPPLPQQ